MCRLYGYFDIGGLGLPHLGHAAAAQLAGGPDEQSAFARDRWGLGVNRLSIQSPSGGRQPYVTQGVMAVFNGEIYNHVALRRELRAKGHHIGDDCDGAVLTPLYAEYGARFVERLEGMFAIALVDFRSEPKLLLASDPLGIKSLYYQYVGQGICFSSELAALVSFVGAPQFDPRAVDGYFTLQSMPPGRTPYRRIGRLLPGELLEVSGGETRSAIVRTAGSADPPRDLDDAAVGLRELLGREVASMSQTHYPFAIKLSGGLDSGFLASLFGAEKRDVTAYHIAYDWRWDEDERRYAAAAAHHAGLELRTVVVRPDDVADLVAPMVSALGMPNAAPHALSSHILFDRMQQDGFRVCVSGEGADEQFAGYRRHRRAAADDRPGWWARYLDRISVTTAQDYSALYTQDYRAFLADLARPADPPADTPDRRLQLILDFDRHVKLPAFNLCRLDHLGMAKSIEVRVPFCQPAVTRFATALPNELLVGSAQGKRVLFEAARAHVPPPVWNRTKQPFTFPLETLIGEQARLRQLVQDVVAGSTLVSQGILYKTAVRNLARDSANSAKLLWAVMILELWLRRPHPPQRDALATRH